MFEGNYLEALFRLSSCLHQDRDVAICVLVDSCDEISLTRKSQSRRYGHKQRAPEEGLPQIAFYKASERWEKDQESECPVREPRYVPSQDDQLVRYVKNLTDKSLDWNSTYAAVGLGCLLYSYKPHEVSALSEDVFQSENIRRVKQRMSTLMKQRFQGARGFPDERAEIPLTAANALQRILIQESLSSFAPWSCCSGIAIHSGFLLDTYFYVSSTKSEWERSHVLFDPTCAGLSRLVHEYNLSLRKGSRMLDDPENKLRAPKFGDGSNDSGPDGDGPSDVQRRFNPPPLTRNEIATIRHFIERNDRRRANYRAGSLRVVVDGEQRARFADSSRLQPFSIPATASWVEVFGEDHLGELLLAVLPLTHRKTDDDHRHLMLSVAQKRRSPGEFSISTTLLARNEPSEMRVLHSFRRYLTKKRKKLADASQATDTTNLVKPWYHLADGYISADCSDLVRAYMKRSSGLIERGYLGVALEPVKEAVLLDPDCWQARLRYGALLVETGRLDEGSEQYQHILAHTKGNSVASAAAYHNQATELERRFGFRRPGKVNEKIALKYERALKLDPLRVRTRAPLVCAYQRLGELKKARKLFRESLIYGEAFIRAVWEELDMSLDSQKLVPAILSWTKHASVIRISCL